MVRFRAALVALACLLPAFGASCPSDSTSATPDPASPDAASPETASPDTASPGAVDAPAMDAPIAACEARCVQDLIATCTPLEGACTAELDQVVAEARFCFVNGAKYVRKVDATMSLDQFINADGLTCYTLQTSLVPGRLDQIQKTWRNGLGALVATGVTDRTKMESIVTCADGSRYLAGPACTDKQTGTSSGCNEGTCR